MNEKKNAYMMPVAIIVAGLAIAGAVIYSNTKNTTPEEPKKDTPMVTIAKKIGLDAETFASCMEANTFTDEISKQQTFSSSLGLRGTPHSIVILPNGSAYRIPGAYPYEAVDLSIKAGLAGVKTEKIQKYFDLFQEEGATQEKLSAYVQKEFTPLITKAQEEGAPTKEALQKQTADPSVMIKEKDAILTMGRMRGSADAKIVIALFTDPECPFCAEFDQTMEEIYATYGATGDVAQRQIYFFPFDKSPSGQHPLSRSLAHGAECATQQGGDDMFWNYSKATFAWLKAGKK